MTYVGSTSFERRREGSADAVLRGADPSSSQLPPASVRTSAPPHLLIVDDIKDNRAVLARRFIRRGYKITEAECGEQALALMEQQSFDTVLLDIIMPGLNGFEVLRRARQRFSSSELPIIMVTAKSDSQDVVQAFADDANDYVTKPVDFAVALARVNAQVERKQAEEEVRRISNALRQSNDVLMLVNEQLRAEVSQRQKSEAKSLYLAHHDALTDLPNRLRFRQALEAALGAECARRQDVAVLFIDLDGFKSVNDTIGHSIGDLLLKSVAGDLQSVLRDDEQVARLGGDEFAILQIGGHQPANAASLASRVIESVEQSRLIDGHQLNITASIGIATNEIDDDPELLLQNADLAMYRAKAEGRGTYRIYQPAMGLLAQERRRLDTELRSALRLGQFEVFYQPIVKLKNQRISGFEALLRWRHPECGIISPLDFIPMAEENGVINQLGQWVLRQACMDAASWPSSLKIAVNISPVQFASGSLVAMVTEALADSGLRPAQLEVEITESVMLEAANRNMDALKQLRDLGVRISMDDFGTGYSSLGYLLRFKFDKIKLDQSFVQNLTSNPESAAIVTAVSTLAVGFGISTTAEGVETREQMEYLTREGITEAQGWFYSKPVPVAEVSNLIQRFGIED